MFSFSDLKIIKMSDKVFTKAELFEYCETNPNKIFISIHENVYDITKFADEVISHL